MLKISAKKIEILNSSVEKLSVNVLNRMYYWVFDAENNYFLSSEKDIILKLIYWYLEHDSESLFNNSFDLAVNLWL